MANNLFWSLLAELIVLILAAAFRDNKPKMVLALTLGTLFAGMIAYYPQEMQIALERLVSPSLNAISTLNPTAQVGTTSPPINPCMGEDVTFDGISVTINRRGDCHISLATGEVIVGTADRFQDDVEEPEQAQPPCTAFAIKGPVEMDLKIWYGGWNYHSDIDDDQIILAYLNTKVSELQQHQDCPNRGIQTMRIGLAVESDASIVVAKALSGSLLWVILAAFELRNYVQRSEDGRRVQSNLFVGIILLLIGAGFAWVGIMIPTIMNPWVNLIGFPLLQLVLIFLVLFWIWRRVP